MNLTSKQSLKGDDAVNINRMKHMHQTQIVTLLEVSFGLWC